MEANSFLNEAISYCADLGTWMLTTFGIHGDCVRFHLDNQLRSGIQTERLGKEKKCKGCSNGMYSLVVLYNTDLFQIHRCANHIDKLL